MSLLGTPFFSRNINRQPAGVKEGINTLVAFGITLVRRIDRPHDVLFFLECHPVQSLRHFLHNFVFSLPSPPFVKEGGQYLRYIFCDVREGWAPVLGMVHEKKKRIWSNKCYGQYSLTKHSNSISPYNVASIFLAPTALFVSVTPGVKADDAFLDVALAVHNWARTRCGSRLPVWSPALYDETLS